ncbi:MAG: hypothetical protein KTR31_16250 [Myxococcales bacterium]|nr:hypothetical protein [Myxococcales bacterium]
MIRPILLCVACAVPATASADPFNTWGARVEPGVVGFNPYAGADGGEPWGSLYFMAGIAPSLDVVVGTTAVLDGQRVVPESLEIMPRLFVSRDVELALAAHLFLESGSAPLLGPEMHLSGYVTPAVGLWANAGAQYAIGAPDEDPTLFAWLGVEVTDDVPFVALEVDLDSTGPELSTTVIPSIGLWLGRDQGTGVSVGWLVDVATGGVGIGAWMWREVDLRSRKRL